MDLLRVLLLGQFTLYAADEAIKLPTKASEVFARLALHPEYSMRRERLAGTLWPDLPEERALGNLNTTLWRIRTEIKRAASGGGYLPFVGDRMVIGLDKRRIYVDSWEFEELASGRSNGLDAIERAVALYRGDLLENHTDADWLVPHRRRLQQLYHTSLLNLGRALSVLGLRNRAEAVYERLVEMDPFNEEVCREAMEYYYHNGQRGKALHLFFTIAHRLKEELKTEPERKTRLLFDHIRGGYSAWDQTQPTLGLADRFSDVSSEMVGRERDLVMLARSWDRALEGRLVVAGIHGEAGIGKSRLALEFADSIRIRGYRVLYGRWEEFPGSGPYRVVLRTLGVEMGRGEERNEQGREESKRLESLVVDGSETIGSGERGIEAKARFYRAVANSLRADTTFVNGALIVLEDVQFADSASLDLLAYLSKALRSSKIMLLLTWRAEDCSPRTLRLLNSPRLMSVAIHLARLGARHLAIMCQGFLETGFVQKRIVEYIYSHSEGNPLFALEILRGIKHRQGRNVGILLGQGDGRIMNALVPANIRTLVQRRIRKLSRHARVALRFSASLGYEVDPDILVGAIGTPWEAVQRSLDELETTGFLTVREGAAHRFSHDKIRMISYESIPVAEKRRIHRVLLSILETLAPSRLSEIAFHAERCREYDKASACWEAVGDDAARIWAYRDAALAYERATECHVRLIPRPADSSRHFSLLRKRALCWEHVGAFERMMADLSIMLEISRNLQDPTFECEVGTLKARALLKQDNPRDALREAERVLRLTEELSDTTREAKVREVLALAHYRQGNYAAAELAFRRVIALFQESDDTDGLARAWGALSRVKLLQGNSSDALHCIDRADTYASGDLNERALRNVTRGLLIGSRGDIGLAIASFESASSDFRRAGNDSGDALAHNFLAYYDFHRGDLARAIENARKGLPHRCGVTDLRWRLVALTHLAQLSIGLGSFQSAGRLLTKAMDCASQPEGRANVAEQMAALACERDDFTTALSIAQRIVESRPLVPPDPYLGSWLVTLGRANTGLGRFREAVGTLEKAVEILRNAKENLTLVQALSHLAVALHGAGRSTEALQLSRESVELMTKLNGAGFRPQQVYWHHFMILADRGDAAAPQFLNHAFRIVQRQAGQLGARGRVRYLRAPINSRVVETWEKLFDGGSRVGLPEVPLHPDRFSAGATAIFTHIRVMVPSAGVPRGTRLRWKDFIEVMLTADAGELDARIRGLKGPMGLRRARILRFCAEAAAQGGELREHDLARMLGVSLRTVKSDIAALRSQGCFVATRGRQLPDLPVSRS